AGDARVAVLRLRDFAGGFFVHLHGTEFIYLETPAVDAHAALLENDPPARRKLDGNGNEQAYRQHEYRNDAAQQQVLQALDHARRAFHRAAADVQRVQAGNRADAVIQQGQVAQVRQIADVDGLMAQRMHDVLDRFALVQRQAQP